MNQARFLWSGKRNDEITWLFILMNDLDKTEPEEKAGPCAESIDAGPRLALLPA